MTAQGSAFCHVKFAFDEVVNEKKEMSTLLINFKRLRKRRQNLTDKKNNKVAASEIW